MVFFSPRVEVLVLIAGAFVGVGGAGAGSGAGAGVGASAAVRAEVDPAERQLLLSGALPVGHGIAGAEDCNNWHIFSYYRTCEHLLLHFILPRPCITEYLIFLPWCTINVFVLCHKTLDSLKCKINLYNKHRFFWGEKAVLHAHFMLLFLSPTELMMFPQILLDWKKQKKMPKNRMITFSSGTPTSSPYLPAA